MAGRKTKPELPPALPPLPPGWGYNDRGEACFEDECFTLTASPERAPRLEWKPHCEIEPANEAERSLLAALGRGEGLVYSRKPPGGSRGR